MFKALKNLFGSGQANASSAPSLDQQRLDAMLEALGEPALVDRDSDTDRRVDVYAFGRNFIEECDFDAADDEGCVLVTSGMSDALMTPPDGAEVDETLAIELVWYVRDLNPEYISLLRWLAKLPTTDHTWLGHGHTVPMPTPPLTFSPMRNVLLLPPIVRTDRELLRDVEVNGHRVGTLGVHLLHDAEYQMVKTTDGLNAFLDLLDEKDHPLVFAPERSSLLG